jgi:hypothetical protein
MGWNISPERKTRLEDGRELVKPVQYRKAHTITIANGAHAGEKPSLPA